MAPAVPNPLLQLAQSFETARHTNGTISIPAFLLGKLQSQLKLQQSISVQDVTAIVKAIDHNGPTLCSRLDSTAYGITCSILRLSVDCLAYYRGLCLITESLHGTASSSPQQQALMSQRKSELGGVALTWLLRNFVKIERSDQARRWMGSLALELLKGCDKNKARLRRVTSPPWRSLGSVIMHGKCQILKILAGSIIREMVAFGAAAKDFWPVEDNSEQYAGFPKSQHHTAQWVTDFEIFVDELDSQNLLSQAASDVYFSYAVLIEDMDGKGVRYSTNDESAILVTKSDDLNIVMPASELRPAMYIDISLDQIEEINIDTLDSPSQLSPAVDSITVALSIVFSTGSKPELTHYLNAVPCLSKSIKLAFDNEEAALSVRKKIFEEEELILQKPLGSQTMDFIDVSHTAMHDLDEAFDPGNLRAAATQVNSLLSIQPLPFPSAPLDRVHKDWAKPVNQESQPRASETSKNSIPVGHVTRAISGINAYDHCPNQQPAESKASSDDGSNSSAMWRNTVKLIDSAPELKEPGNRQIDQHDLRNNGALLDRNFQRQGDTPDGLYEESSGGLKAWQQLQTQVQLKGDEARSEKISKGTVGQDFLEGPSLDAGGNLFAPHLEQLRERIRSDGGEATATLSMTIQKGHIRPENLGRDQALREQSLESELSNVSQYSPTSSKSEKHKTLQSIGGNDRQSKGKNIIRNDRPMEDLVAETDDEFQLPISRVIPEKTKPTRVGEHAVAKTNHIKKASRLLSTGGPVVQSLRNESPTASAHRSQPKVKLNGDSTALALSSVRRTRNEDRIGDMDETNWEEGLEVVGEEISPVTRRGKRKTAKHKLAPAAQGGLPKKIQANSTKKRATKNKAKADLPLVSQPRSERAAALTANKRILGLVDLGSDDDEEDVRQNILTSGENEMDETSLQRAPSAIREESRGGIIHQEDLNPIAKDPGYSKAIHPNNGYNRCSEAIPNVQPHLLNHASSIGHTIDAKSSTLNDERNVQEDLVEEKQEKVQGNCSNTINGTLQTKAMPALDEVANLDANENVQMSDSDVIGVGDIHFENAMPFSVPDVFDNPVLLKRLENPLVSMTAFRDVESQVLELDQSNIRNLKSGENEQLGHISPTNVRRPWASKLTDALSIIPKVIDVRPEMSAKKRPQHKSPQCELQADAKNGAQGHLSKIVLPEMPSEEYLGASPCFRAGQNRETGSHQSHFVGNGIGIFDSGMQDHGPLVDLTKKPIIKPASRPSQMPKSELIGISFVQDDNSEMSGAYNPEVAAGNPIPVTLQPDKKIEETTQARKITQKIMNPNVKEDSVSALVGITEPSRLAERGPEQTKKAAKGADTKSMRHVQKRSPLKAATAAVLSKKTPDVNRKSNLISFSAKGPLNQGVLSGGKTYPTITPTHASHNTLQPKDLKTRQQRQAELEADKASPRDDLIAQAHSYAASVVPLAEREVPRDAKRHVDKLDIEEEVQSAFRANKRRKMSSANPRTSEDPLVDKIRKEKKKAAGMPGSTPILQPQRLVAVARMGRDSRSNLVEEGENFTAGTLEAISSLQYPEPITAVARMTGDPLIVVSKQIDEVPTETLGDSLMATPSINQFTQTHDGPASRTDDMGGGVFAATKFDASQYQQNWPHVVPHTKEIALNTREGSMASIGRDFAPRTSSQSTRVDANGSPMPLVHPHKIGRAIYQAKKSHPAAEMSMMANFSEKDGAFMSDEEAGYVESGLKVTKNQQSLMELGLPISSSSRKPQPGSPHNTSSIVDEFEAHRVHPGGNFVNLETDNVIVSERPPDPFMGSTQAKPTSFIKALRRLSYLPDEGIAKVQGTKRSDVRRTLFTTATHGNNEDDDPEKTLVDPEILNSEDEADTASNSDSNSRSSSSNSGDILPSSEPSDSDGRTEGSDWRKALKPHHRQTLDVLHNISHRLVRDLIDKETAVKDIISDYHKTGNRLIDEFEKARKVELDALQKSITREKRRLAIVYKGGEAKLMETLKEVKKRHVTDFVDRWDARNQAKIARLDAMLAGWPE